jgi:hypothetical protein
MTDEQRASEVPADELSADEIATDTPAPPAAPIPREKAGSPPRRRSRAFQRQLLARLPELGVPKWEVSETRQVHQDMQSIADLDADAFLEPLERLAGGAP